MYFDIAQAAGVGPGDRISRKVLFILDFTAHLPFDNVVVTPIQVHASEIDR